MKVLVDADTKRILGAALLGIEGDEVIHSLLEVMYAKAPYTTIAARDAHSPDGDRADPDPARPAEAARVKRGFDNLVHSDNRRCADLSHSLRAHKKCR